jgi:phage repressor protein C with HTH and peptisase S24 domain
MSLGQRIRAVIDSRGLKDVWVADGAGITTTTLSNIIRGVTADPSVGVVAAIADVLGESVDALLGRRGEPLLQHEQETLRSAVTIISERVLPPAGDVASTVTPGPRRRRRRAITVAVTDVAATPNREIFTNVEEMKRYPIPTELRERRGVKRVFRVQGDSMIEAGIQDGDILYVRTDVSRQAAVDEVVVCRHEDSECVKTLRVAANGTVILESANPKYKPVVLTREQANKLAVYGVVVNRLTAV